MTVAGGKTGGGGSTDPRRLERQNNRQSATEKIAYLWPLNITMPHNTICGSVAF